MLALLIVSTVNTDIDLGHETEHVGDKVHYTAHTGTSHSTQLDLACFFCDLPGTDLRQVMTFAVDDRVRKCAHVLPLYTTACYLLN